ncbi:MAG: pyridoxamine 5'-phosphate oxidase family protein, partial [Promethearchaeota archaeon]
MRKSLDFEFVEQEIRKKTFGILSTIDQNGKSHSTGIIYSVSLPESKFSLFILTENNYKKVINIKNDNSVSFVIPFPHHLLRFVPSSCVQFQGTGEILPFTNREAQNAFEDGPKILKMNIKQARKMNPKQQKAVFIKITPNSKIFCYGLGYSLIKLRKDVEIGSYSVIIP